MWLHHEMVVAQGIDGGQAKTVGANQILGQGDAGPVAWFVVACMGGREPL